MELCIIGLGKLKGKIVMPCRESDQWLGGLGDGGDDLMMMAEGLDRPCLTCLLSSHLPATEYVAVTQASRVAFCRDNRISDLRFQW